MLYSLILPAIKQSKRFFKKHKKDKDERKADYVSYRWGMREKQRNASMSCPAKRPVLYSIRPLISIDHGDSLSDKLMWGADDRPGRDWNRADVRLSQFAPT